MELIKAPTEIPPESGSQVVVIFQRLDWNDDTKASIFNYSDRGDVYIRINRIDRGDRFWR